MQIEELGPRTWIIAGVVGWALLAWVLALAGMGGNVKRLGNDPGLLVPLPHAVSAQPALGPADQYRAIAERPLFATDRSPHPFFLEGGEGSESGNGFDYLLTSVLIAPRTRLAIVHKQDGGDPLRVKLGELLAQTEWRLVELLPRGAVFDGPQGRRSLELQVFDGSGGEPASTAAVAGQESQRAQASTSPSPPASSSQPRSQPSLPANQARSADATSRTPASEVESEAVDAANKGADPARAQMDAIRERIEARRAALRNDEK